MADATIVMSDAVIEVDVLGAQGLQGGKGDPGADLGQIGTFADLQALDVLDVQPGATLIRLTDRAGPWRLWEMGMDALNPSYEDVSWTYDGSGVTRWFYSPEQGLVLGGLGVDTSGAVDGTGPLTVTSGRSIRGAGGTYKAGPINLKTQEGWDGDNAKVSTPNSGTTVFLAGDAVHDWRISNFQLYGHRTDADDPDIETECGVQIRDATRGIISNTTFFNFKKAGLLQNATGFANEGSTGRGARVIGYGLGFYKCTIGLKTELNGGNEYSIFGLFHAGGCQVGAEMRAGNTIMVGFNLVDNDDNLHLTGDLGSGSNHLHGITAIGSISHSAESGYLAHFKDVWRGHTLSAIHAYAANTGDLGPMFYENTAAVTWIGGILDATTYVKQNGFDAEAYYPYNRQVGLFLPGDYGPAAIIGRNDADSGWGDYHPHMVRLDCHGPGRIDADGITTNDPSDLYIIAEHLGAATPIAEGDFLKFASSTGVGDRRRAHDPATGLITIPKWLAGQAECGSAFVISGTLTTPNLSYFEMVKNPGVGEVLIAPPFLPMPFGPGTSVWTVVTGTISHHFAEGDVLGIRATSLTGSAPKLGHISWQSQFWFKKIA